MNCNLYGVGGSFDLRAKNWTTEVGGMFMGAHSPRSGDGLFLRWTRLLQRLFSRLPTHFLHLGFKLGGFFVGCLSFSIGCLGSFLSCLVLFISYLDWFRRC